MLTLRQAYPAAHAKTLAISAQAGDLIAVVLYQDGPLVTTSVTDTAGNTYDKAAEVSTPDGVGCGIYLYLAKATTTASLTVTATMAGSGYVLTLANVYAGTIGDDVLHAVNIKFETARTLPHTGPEVTTTKPALLLSVWGEPSGSGTIATADTFVERQEDAGTGTYDRQAETPGTYSNSITSSVAAAFASILAALTETEPAADTDTFQADAFQADTFQAAEPTPVTYLDTPAPPTLQLTGYAPTLARTIQPPTSTLTLSSAPPSLRHSLQAPTSILTLTSAAPSIARSLTPPTATLNLTGYAPDLSIHSATTLDVPTAYLSLTGYAPSLRRTLQPPTASLTLSSAAPSLRRSITPPTAILTLNTTPPTLRHTLQVPAPTTLTLTSAPPTLRRSITPPTSTLTLSSAAPSIARTIQPPTAILTLTAYTPTLVMGAPRRVDPRYASTATQASYRHTLTAIPTIPLTAADYTVQLEEASYSHTATPQDFGGTA